MFPTLEIISPSPPPKKKGGNSITPPPLNKNPVLAPVNIEINEFKHIQRISAFIVS